MISSQTFRLIKAMLEMGLDKSVAACLLEMGEVNTQKIRYFAAPIIAYPSPWQDTIPQWLLKAIYQERLEALAIDNSPQLATPAEVLTYLYPASLITPIGRDYTDIYLWSGSQVFPKYGKVADEQSFWQLIGSQPIQYRSIQHCYEPLASWLYQKAVQAGKQQGWGNCSKRQKHKTEEPVAASAQLSLF